MKKNIFTLAFIALLFLTSHAKAQFSSSMTEIKIGPDIDMTTVNIAGVSLGMSQEDAINALIEKLEISRDDLKIGRPTNPKFGANPATGKSYVERISYSIGKGISQTVYKIEFLPNVITPEKSNSVVSSVNYFVPFTQENVDGLYQATVKKFGTPSYVSYGDTKWCGLETKKQTGFNGTYTACKPNTAYMEISNSSLNLTSKEFRIALNQYKAKAVKSDFNF